MSVTPVSFDSAFAKMVGRLQAPEFIRPLILREEIAHIQKYGSNGKALFCFLQNTLCDLVLDVTQFPNNLSREDVIILLQFCFLKWNEQKELIKGTEQQQELTKYEIAQGNIKLVEALEACSFQAYLFPEMQGFFIQEKIVIEFDSQKIFQKTTAQMVKHHREQKKFQRQQEEHRSAFRKVHQETTRGLHRSADFHQMSAFSAILDEIQRPISSKEELLDHLLQQMKNIQNNPFLEEQFSTLEQVEMLKEIFFRADASFSSEEKEQNKARLRQTIEQCQFSQAVMQGISDCIN
jgi:hypothetical protein